MPPCFLRRHILESDSKQFDFRFKIRFGDSEEGRLRLHQTADVVIILLNNPMGDIDPDTIVNGICGRDLFKPDRPRYLPVVALHASYGKILFIIHRKCRRKRRSLKYTYVRNFLKT